MSTSEAMQRNGLRSMDTAEISLGHVLLEIYTGLNAACIICSVLFFSSPPFLSFACGLDRVCLEVRVKIGAHVVAFD